MNIAGERVLLMAWRLSLVGRWRRVRHGARSPIGLIVSIVIATMAVLTACVAAARFASVRIAVEWIDGNAGLTGVSMALGTLTFIVRRRAQLRAESARSWLVATPIATGAFRTVAAIRIALAVTMQTTVLTVALLGLAAVNGMALAMLSRVAICLAIGSVAGASVGSLWPRPKPAMRSEASRFTRKPRAASTSPALDGLARWPVAEAVAWHRPENSRLLFLIAVFSVPAGASALLGAAILTAWTLVSYLIALARAVPAVAREAALWLRPTTLPFAAFAWALVRRALIHQVLGMVLLAAAGISLGGRVNFAIYLAGLWWVSFLMIAAIGIRQGHRLLPSSTRTLLSILLVLIVESWVRGCGLAVATLITLAHAYGSLRERR